MFLLLTNSNKSGSTSRKKTLSQKVEFGMSSLIFATIVIVCILSLTFLTQSNRRSTHAYKLQEIEQERQRLITESQILNMKISQVQSLNAIENDPIVANMVTFKDPVFIRGNTAVASNDEDNNG